jgi:Ca2+-transporting ATPase
MGIAGTDAAKAAANMVLVNDTFSTIVDAVEEGRRIYANISKFVYFLLSTNIAEVFLILFASFIGLQSPLVPVQILWLNLMTDSLPALALANEPMEQFVMTRTPIPRGTSIINKLMIWSIFLHTVILTAVTLGTYIYGLCIYTSTWNGQPTPMPENPSVEFDNLAYGIRRAQTMVIFVIVFAELLRGYTSRSLVQSLWEIGVCTNSWMQYSVILSIALTFLVGLIPKVNLIFGMEFLDAPGWIWVCAFSIAPALLDEFLKAVYRCTGFAAQDPHVPLVAGKEFDQADTLEEAGDSKDTLVSNV